jgi:Ca2+-transporting ATPase
MNAVDVDDSVQAGGHDDDRPGAKVGTEPLPQRHGEQSITNGDVSRGTPRGPADRGGLTAEDAAERLASSGPNVVSVARRVRLPWRILQQLRDPLIAVLLVAAALTVVTGDHADAIIIVLVVVVNTVVGVVQEVRADSAIAALGALTAPTARVIRSGTSQVVPACDVVPGDLVELGEGDIVPADAVLVEAAAVLVDESALTGESVPVDKTVAQEPTEPAAGVLQAGTVVVRGRAVARVTDTGARSAMGRIAALMDTRPGLTPLQRRLVGLGRWLAGLAVALCLVVMALGLLQGQPVELMVVTAVSLVVAAVPESLPAVVTLALALGARRMAARQAVVRRLPAVETLGSVTVIATDKTGTLTEGNMVVEAVWTPDGEALVTGRGYAPVGHVVTDTGPGTAPDVAVRAVLAAGARCNDARLVPGDPESGRPWSVLGDPTEGALLAAAAKVGLERQALDAVLPRIAELPFDSLRRRMTTVHRGDDGSLEIVCKGAPDVLLRAPLVDASATLLATAEERAATYAASGYRVLAVAARHVAPEDPAPAEDPGDRERGLTLLGLVAIADPPREAAAATVAACRAAGITPVLITGDHVATARAVAIRLGLAAEGDEIASGYRLARTAAGDDTAGDDTAGGDTAEDDTASEPLDPTRVRVFARTSPEQKLQIVRAWQASGHVVAMTGDGVNDGPALHQADIGVSMGRRGTEVARQASDLVLADDDLATVVAAVEEGRRVYANVRRFLLYGLSGGVAEILVMLLGPAVGLALPLLPAQILWINLVTHGMPGVAFGAEPATPDVMRRPPRPPAQSVLGDGLWQRIGRTASVITLVTLGVGIWAHASGRPWQTLVFLTLGVAQLAVALGVRARPGTWTNPTLLLAVLGALAAQLGAVYLPVLQALLSTHGPSLIELTVVGAVALPGYVVARLDRRLADRRHALYATPAVDPSGAPGCHDGRDPQDEIHEQVRR